VPVLSSIRESLIAFDRFAFGGRGLTRYRRWVSRRKLDDIVQRSSHNTFAIHYSGRSFAAFAHLCDKYGSDKGTRAPGPHPYPHQPHAYADFYALMFDHCRLSVRKVFECGLGTNNPSIPSNMGITGRPGASLRAWRDYFPNAFIYGADIDPNVLFSENRIITFQVDQTSPESVAALWRHPDLCDFDVFVDDGLHTFDAGIALFQNSFHRVRPGGVYIIEDVPQHSLQRFCDYFEQAAVDYSHATSTARCRQAKLDSTLIIIRKPYLPNAS
jgi:hypothetical protein